MLLSAVEKGEATTIEAKRIGPPLLFERLWRDSFCRAVIEDLLVRWYRKFGQWLKLGSRLRRTDLDDEQTEAVFGGFQGEGGA
jgi:hypothetical protein